MMGTGGLLCVCLVLFVCVIHTSCVTDRDDIVNAARCRVRCLAHLDQASDADSGLPSFLSRLKSSTSLIRCLEDPNCTACLKPCSQPFSNLALCERVCEVTEESCELSCAFLEQCQASRPGQCPNHGGTSEFTSSCRHNCQKDTDCPVSDHKCCENHCGRTCQLPKDIYKGIPEIPSAPTIRERAKGGSIELKWDAVMTNETGQVLYIVDTRWNIGKHHSEPHMNRWQQILQTTTTSSILRGVTPGHWYEYRIGAVSINGSRGVSPATKPFKLSREPQPPSSPQNLTEGKSTVYNRKVSVMVHWLQSQTTDLPITRYKVFWSERLRSVSANLISLKEHRKVLQGNELNFELVDLKPDTRYLVQVQAICQYGDSRLKSERASIIVNTFPLPQASDQIGPTPVIAIEPLPTPAALHSLTVHHPFFQNGLLKANVSWSLPADLETPVSVHKIQVYWSPEVCIASLSDSIMDDSWAKTMSASTHENYFIVYDLRFACRYVVKVQPVSRDGISGSVSHISFPTPSCSEVVVKGPVAPDCPSNVPRVPEEPVSFQHTFLISSSNITARLSWGIPLSDASITGYRIVWGQALSRSQPGVLDKNTALTKVLSKDSSSYTIGKLQEAVTYIARVQALSRIGSGKVASVQFSTPILRITPHDPPYIRITPEMDIRAETPLPPSTSRMMDLPLGGTTQQSSYVDSSTQTVTFNVTAMVLCILILVMSLEMQ